MSGQRKERKRCAPACSSRCSTSWPIRRSSLGSLARRRRPAGTGSSSGTSCAGARPSGRSPTPGSRWPRSRRRPSGCGSGRWSRRCRAAGPPRSPARPRRWTCSAAAGSPSASASAATGSPASSPRPASSSTTGAGARCSTRHWRSSPPPGPVSRFTTTASTTPSTTSRSCPGRCSGPACRCGSLASPATPSRCAGRPGYDGFFPVNLEHPDQLAEVVARVGALREEAGRAPDEPYEVIAEVEPGTDPAPYREAGATWLLAAPDWEGISVDGVRGVIREGPATHGGGNDEGHCRDRTPHRHTRGMANVPGSSSWSSRRSTPDVLTSSPACAASFPGCGSTSRTRSRPTKGPRRSPSSSAMNMPPMVSPPPSGAGCRGCWWSGAMKGGAFTILRRRRAPLASPAPIH